MSQEIEERKVYEERWSMEVKVWERLYRERVGLIELLIELEDERRTNREDFEVIKGEFSYYIQCFEYEKDCENVRLMSDHMKELGDKLVEIQKDWVYFNEMILAVEEQLADVDQMSSKTVQSVQTFLDKMLNSSNKKFEIIILE